MRVLSPIGSSLLLLGAYVFTSGDSGSTRYMIPGGCIALAGVVVLALAAILDPVPDKRASERSRGETTDEERSEEMDRATASG